MKYEHQQWTMEQILAEGNLRNHQQKFERRISEYTGYLALFLSVSMIVGGLVILI